MALAAGIVARAQTLAAARPRVGTAQEQALRHHDMAAEGGPMQRRLAVGVGDARVGAGGEQQIGELGIGMQRREVQRGFSVPGARTRVGAVREQRLRETRHASLDRAVQRRVAARVARIRVGALLLDQLEGGALAAELGLPFAFAHFINPRGGDEVTRLYKDRFKPSGGRTSPRAMVCTFAIVGETDDEAERLAAPIDLRRLHMALNVDSPVPTAEEAARHRYSEEERRYVMGQRARAIIGGPAKAKQEFEQLRERYQADEVMVLTITGDYESRMRSYELLIGAFE